jgi:hypothetical protein
MDLSLFEEKYKNDEKGADAYSPKALLKIIMYCYSTVIILNRLMEKACKIVTVTGTRPYNRRNVRDRRIQTHLYNI